MIFFSLNQLLRIKFCECSEWSPGINILIPGVFVCILERDGLYSDIHVSIEVGIVLLSSASLVQQVLIFCSCNSKIDFFFGSCNVFRISVGKSLSAYCHRYCWVTLVGEILSGDFMILIIRKCKKLFLFAQLQSFLVSLFSSSVFL